MTFYDGGANTLAAQNACSCVFSPVSPLFRGRTGRQIKTGRQQPYFARSSFGCFLPVNLVFIVAALLSRCRCGGACPPSRLKFYFDGDDSALTSQSFYSPEANIIVVFLALSEKPSELKLVKISGQIKELILQSIHSE